MDRNSMLESYFLGKKPKKTGFQRVIFISLTTSFLTIFVPLLFYYFNFTGGLSEKQEHWGAFGDYIGGIIGTLFSFFALIFSMYSLYVSSMTTHYIQDKQEELNSRNEQNEKLRLDKEIELTHKQNKPYPYLEIYKFNDETTLTIYNYGIGPLIITKSHILYNAAEAYESIIHLIEKKIETKPQDTDVIYNSAPTHILPPNGSKQLFSIKPKGEISTNFKEFQETCRTYIAKCIITIEYEDIFENKYTFKNAFSFLGN